MSRSIYTCQLHVINEVCSVQFVLIKTMLHRQLQIFLLSLNPCTYAELLLYSTKLIEKKLAVENIIPMPVLEWAWNWDYLCKPVYNVATFFCVPRALTVRPSCQVPCLLPGHNHIWSKQMNIKLTRNSTSWIFNKASVYWSVAVGDHCLHMPLHVRVGPDNLDP